ncbi:DUF5615 family PIN-like protein [Crocosphaera sp.]|uniref:DUF5615 family PIN-like protein n=1 Tax=Crocosphaera sp. TaxID=2729996 RepID=UPI00262D00FA|nr:DUF5615 family PIN-like protein [Crocosphaera sp.]MDJ0579468.1 DUF5615 family PIN-like protein [Crocosphaera sp.]
MKFLADMGISQKTLEWLRNQGYNTVHLREEGLQRLDDEAILIKAKNEERIILTMDLDFTNLLAWSKDILPSVIIFRLGNENYDKINPQLEKVIGQCENELLTGAIISVSDGAFRVRNLPI